MEEEDATEQLWIRRKPGSKIETRLGQGGLDARIVGGPEEEGRLGTRRLFWKGGRRGKGRWGGKVSNETERCLLKRNKLERDALLWGRRGG